MSTPISIRLPDALAQELDHIAKETERPRSYHMQQALQNYLDEQADLQIALDRLHDPNDRLVTSEELRKSLGL